MNQSDQIRLNGENSEIKSKKTKVRHNRQESRRLEDWVLSQWGRIEKERPTRVELAGQAAKGLGMNCTASIISSCCEAIGKEFPRPAHSNTRTLGSMNGTTRKRWTIITNSLIDLFKRCGEAIPNQLIEFRKELNNLETPPTN